MNIKTKVISTVLIALVGLGVVGCGGASYKEVKPTMSKKVEQVSYRKTAEFNYQNKVLDTNRTMGGIILDMKVIPHGRGAVSAKLYADKYIRFDYIGEARVLSFVNPMIASSHDIEEGVPTEYLLLQKVELPAYKIGINVFDINTKGNFAYIADKKTIKVVKRMPTDTLKALSKNHNYSKGRNVLTIKTKKAVKQILFQPNSDYLIVLLENNEIELWNYLKKKKIKTIVKNSNKVTSIKVSPLGNYLLVSHAKESSLVNLKSKKTVLSIADNITAVDFTQDEKRMALTGASAQVMVYDLDTKKLLQKFPHKHKGLVYGLAFNPADNETVVTAGQDGVMVAWDLLNTKKAIAKNYNTYNKKSNCNAKWLKKQYFPKTSQSLSVLNKKYNLKMTECNILGDKSQVVFLAQKGALHPYMIALVDTLVNKYKPVKQEWVYLDVLDPYVGSAKKEIYEWKRSQGMTTVTVNKGTANEKLENKFIYDKAAYQKYLNTDKKILSYKKKAVEKYTEYYTQLIAQMNAGSIYGLVKYGNNIYPYGTGYQYKYSYFQTKTPNVRMAVGIAQYKFDFASENKQSIYQVIEKDTFKGAGRTKYVIKTKDEHTIITVKDNLVEFLDYKANKLVDVVTENAEIKAVAYDKKNDILAIGLTNNLIKLWNLKTKQPIGQLTGHKGEIVALSFAKEGKVLISGAYDETAIVWNMQTKKKITQFNGFERAAKRIQVLPKQNMVVLISSGNNNSDVFFYSLDNFKLLKKVSPEAGIIRGVAFDKEGKRVILASSGEVLHRNKGHILLTIDTSSFKVTKQHYKPNFTYIRGLVANEKMHTLYAIGNSSTFEVFDLDTFEKTGTLSNMKNDNYNWGKIYSVGTTEQHTPIVADGNKIISIYK